MLSEFGVTICGLAAQRGIRSVAELAAALEEDGKESGLGTVDEGELWALLRGERTPDPWLTLSLFRVLCRSEEERREFEYGCAAGQGFVPVFVVLRRDEHGDHGSPVWMPTVFIDEDGGVVQVPVDRTHRRGT